MAKNNTPLYRFWAPKYWHVWLGLAAMRLVSMLPHAMQRGIGHIAGVLSFRLVGSRRRVAEENIAKCFPELDSQEQKTLVRRHFDALGLSLIHMAGVWFSPVHKTPRIVSLNGLEHLERAATRGRGVILLMPHVTSTEMGARLLLTRFQFHAVYRRFENPLFQEVMHRRRTVLARKAIPKDNIREMIRSLRTGHAVLYMPDQAYRRKGSIQAPFFSYPAPTNPGTARLARMTDAPVVMFFPYWDWEEKGYRLELFPPLAGFPSSNPENDAARINAAIEALVRRAPEQYLWVHQRFKQKGGEAKI